MPERRTIQRARRDKRRGKSASTQAGEFVREEVEHIREGKHGARSAKQAIAIGLSKARRAGVRLPKRAGGRAAGGTGHRARNRPSARRSRGILRALRREPRSGASHLALARQAKRSARTRGPRARHLAAVKAIRTKGPAGLRAAARKAAHTREAQAA